MSPSRKVFRILVVSWSALLLGAGPPGALSPGSSAGPAASSHARRSITYSSRTMGTYVNVTLVAEDSIAGAPLAIEAFSVFGRVDSLMSNWTATSEVARLNREAARGPTLVHPEVARVIDASLEIWRGSEGVFDITVEPLVRAWGFLGGHPHVPTEAEAAAAFRRVGARHVVFDAAARILRFDSEGTKIDLGGIAKGYAVDAAAESLKARGVENALVDLSGNMFALGAPPGSDHWRIGIRDPRDRLRYFAMIRLTGRAISTSGKYEQFVAADGKTYGHIIDPRTGRPAEGLISVTVVAPTALASDSWDTPLFVLGAEAAMRKARELPDIEAVLVQPGEGGVDTVWVESSLKDRFTLDPAAQGTFTVRYF